MKKILILNLFIFSVLILNAQSDTVKMKRNNAILLNKKGLEFYNQKDYKNAIECFTKAIIADSSFGDPFYNRAKSIINLNPKEFIDFDKCNEFHKAIKLGKKISEEELFFYGCTLNEDIKHKKKK